MIDIKLDEIKMSLEKAIGLEEVYLVDNCLIRTLSLEELRKNPRAYFTTKRILDEHTKWREVESREFLQREQRKGHLFRLNEIERPITRIEELLRSKEYKNIVETAKVCDEIEGTQTKDFEKGLLYTLQQFNIRIDLTDDEAQKNQTRKYFAELQQTHALLLEEYSIKINLEDDRIWLKGKTQENRKICIKNSDELATRFDHTAERQRLELQKQQIMQEGQEFFRAETIANCFETDLKDQILYMHAGETFERYSRLLTKRIVADILELNIDNARDYLVANRINYVVGTGIAEYKKRIVELGLEGAITQERINETKGAMYIVLTGLYKDISQGKEMHQYWRQFRNSIKSDLSIVCAAFEKRFSAKIITILSSDRDVREMVDYLSLAQQAGKIRSQNQVRYSLAA